MAVRFIALALIISSCVFFGAPARAGEQLVVATNDSGVCVSFHAVGVELNRDLSSAPRGANLRQIGPYRILMARPGETVRFDDLAGTRAQVWANPHATAQCTKQTGVNYGPYATQGPHEHIAFRRGEFVHVAFL